MICFKCNQKTSGLGSMPWRGSRICAACAGKKPREDKPLVGLANPAVTHHQARRGNAEFILPINSRLAESLWRPHERVKVSQARIPTMGGTRPMSEADRALIAKIRGDIELRSMTITQAARANKVSYNKVYDIYQGRHPHIEPV